MTNLTDKNDAIDVLNISNRSLNVLTRAKVATIKDMITFLDHSDSYLLATVPGLGPFTLREIRAAFDNWAADQPEPDPNA